MPPTAKADRTPPPDREFRGPPEEEFWERYNRRLEFPLSTVAAVLVHVAIGALLVFILVKLMDHGDDGSLVPVKLVELGGFDEVGDGSAGSGGEVEEIKQGENQFKAAQNILPTPEALANAKAEVRKILLDDPNGDLPVSAQNAAAFKVIDEALAKKVMGVRRGDGPGQGTGNDGSAGKGPGGNGSDSTRARSLRWVLRFKTADGQDYVNQLAAMGATVLVPLPPENRECLYFPELRNPAARRTASEDDLKQLSTQIKFSDTRPSSVAGVCGALGVQQPARSFWAFFPRSLEEELSRRELNYRNRRSEDIEETIFQVVVRGGSYEVVVVGQTVKQ